VKYKSGYKYQLAEYYQIMTGIKGFSARYSFLSLYKTGRLGIEEGYAWDGPSGPAIDTRNFMRGSLVHDALYQLMRRGRMDAKTSREQADRLLQKMCIEDGMWRIRAWWVYKSLRWFGGAASDPENQRPVIKAP